MIGKLLAMLMIFPLCSDLAAQTTYYVNNVTGSDSSSGTSPNNPKQTIQAAIVAASSGDSISVAATGKVYSEMIQVSGKTLMFASSAGIPELLRLTVNQPSLNYELHLINSFKVDSLVLRNGLIYTGMNGSIILPSGSQGFDRSGVVGSNISHIVGQVSRVVSAGRNEFPVGTAAYYRPVALTFNVNPGGMVKVRHVDSKPTGMVGLPIIGGIQSGIDVARFAPFYWSVVVDSNISSTILYHLELTAAGFADFDSSAPYRVGIIRRVGTASDSDHIWVNQGGQENNVIADGILTVARLNSVGGLSSDGTIFTYGLKAKLVVANPFTVSLHGPSPLFKRSLLHPPLFTGNEGPLRFTVTVKDSIIVRAEILFDDTLVATGKRGGLTTLTISGADSAGNKAAYVAGVCYDCIVDCWPSPFEGRPILDIRNVAFGNVEVGKYRDTTLTISSFSCSDFDVTISTDNTNFSVIPPRGTVGRLIDTIRFAPSSTGQLSGKISVKSSSGYLDTLTVSGFGVPVTYVEGTQETPVHYSVFQNYPNPFNPSTTISYELPSRSHVTLKVYNLLGQEIATLVNEIQDAGSKSVEFEGSHLPSGVYLYRLQAGKLVENKKMILVK